MISREDLVEQSVFDFAQSAVFNERGYPMDKVEFRENFPYRLDEAFTINIVAAGFNFDYGGQQAECCSQLKRRLYTIYNFESPARLRRGGTTSPTSSSSRSTRTGSSRCATTASPTRR